MMLTEAHIPAHVPRERVVDIDVYDPPERGEKYFAAWKQFQDRSPELVWTPRNGGRRQRRPQSPGVSRPSRSTRSAHDSRVCQRIVRTCRP